MSDAHLVKVAFSIIVTVSGILMDVSDEHSLKAAHPIIVTVSGI